MDTTIEKCSSKGNVIALRQAGGIAGACPAGKVTMKQNCNYASVTTTGTYTDIATGGLIRNCLLEWIC
jgi:hypothetical protein